MEALYARNLTVDDVFAEDAEIILPGRAPIRGREAIGDFVRQFLVACPDYTLTIQSLIAEGDTVALEFSAPGAHDGPLRLPGGQAAARGQAFRNGGVGLA